MTTVPTVTGDVDSDDLGTTLMHEHIIILTPELQDAFPGFMGFDEDAVVAAARDRLIALKARGVDTIVDLTAPGLGRNVRRIAGVVAGTGMQVIACTGYYTYADLPFPFKYNGPGKLFADPDDEMLTSLFVRDITEGIEGTDIRAGILKCCTDAPGLTEDVDRVLRACARAHLRTGVPIATHTNPMLRRGLDQQRVFRSEGVDLGRVVIGHCNESTDLDYLEEMLQAGSYLGFDKCGQEFSVSHDDQLDTVAELCRRGHDEKIVLSHDYDCYSDWFTEESVASVLPRWNFDYIGDAVLPGLRERGVTDEQIRRLTVENPRAFFGAR